MIVLPTKYTEQTGVAVAMTMPKHWRHIDTNDGGHRVVGSSYSSKKDILSDHISYLLTAGWLRLNRPLPVPTLAVSVTFGAYAWQMSDDVIGISVYGNTKVEAILTFMQAVHDEYGSAVTLTENAIKPVDRSSAHTRLSLTLF